MPKHALHRLELLLALGLVISGAIMLGAILTAVGVGPSVDLSPYAATIANRFFDIAKLVGGFILVVLAVPVATLVVYRLLELVLRPEELVMNSFITASGMSFLDSMTPGLSAQMREQVIKEGLDARRLFRERGAKYLPRGYSTPDDWPLPKRAADYAVASLEAGLRGSLSQQVAPLAHLISIFLPATGHSVSCTLQVGKIPIRVGMTVEIADLRGRDRPRIHTVWLSDRDLATVALHNPPTSNGLSSTLTANLAGIYSELVVPAATWVAIEFFRSHAEKWLTRRHLFQDRRKIHAKVRHYIGEQFEVAALTMTDYPSIQQDFLLLAIHNFKRAHELDSGWFLPVEGMADCHDWMCRTHECVANALKMPGERQNKQGPQDYPNAENETDVKQAANEQELAVTLQKKALRLACKHGGSRDEIARLRVGLVLAQLLANLAQLPFIETANMNSDEIAASLKHVWDDKLSDRLQHKHREDNERKDVLKFLYKNRKISDIPKWRHEVALILYTLACCYSLRCMELISQGKTPAKDDYVLACEYFGCSLLLDWDRMSDLARTETDLRAIGPHIDSIRAQVKPMVEKHPELAKLSEHNFVELVNKLSAAVSMPYQV